jgi:ribosomal protein L37E
MAMEVCANCGEPLTLTKTECDACGWVPASKEIRAALAIKKEMHRRLAAD